VVVKGFPTHTPVIDENLRANLVSQTLPVARLFGIHDEKPDDVKIRGGVVETVIGQNPQRSASDRWHSNLTQQLPQSLQPWNYHTARLVPAHDAPPTSDAAIKGKVRATPSPPQSPSGATTFLLPNGGVRAPARPPAEDTFAALAACRSPAKGRYCSWP